MRNKVKNRPVNTPMVERPDSSHGADRDQLKHYSSQMTTMFGNTQLPAVLYKGVMIPRRVLSDFSYLTKS